jgi:hypothetical protein
MHFIGLTPNEQQTVEAVRQKYPDIKWGDAYLEGVWVGNRRDLAEPDEHEKCIRYINPDKEKYILGYCTEEYAVIPYELTLHSLEEEISKLNMSSGFGDPRLKCYLVQGGRKFKAEVDFPACQYDIRPGQPVSPRVNLYRSYDLGWEYGINFGAMEQVCTNGMIAWRVKSSLRRKHRRSLNQTMLISDIMEGMEMFGDQIAVWKRWTQISITTQEQVTELMDALPFGAEHKREILALPSADDHLTVFDYLNKGQLDAWRMHSFTTQFLTHEVESEVVRETKTEQVARIFDTRFGHA